MWLKRLLLRNYRNYPELDLDLTKGVTVLHGENAQGKTNLLEAIYLLATGRSFRAGADRELVAQCLPPNEFPVARVAAETQRAGGSLSIDVVIAAPGWSDALAASAAAQPRATGAYQKRVRINGVPRRLLDLVGQVPAVLFTPEDLELVAGPPALRRRYLDIMLSQLDSRYARSLSRYQRILQQRNHLLKLLAEGRADRQQLGVWDAHLVDEGATIIAQRLRVLNDLGPHAAEVQGQLTGGRDTLAVAYQTVEGVLAEAATAETVRPALTAALQHVRARELAQGLTLVGPHRDDLELTVNGMPAGSYGSRGQQRTVSLALKLAEAGLLRREGQEEPVLLLDDVLSELDAPRRRALTAAARQFDQVLMTTADLDALPTDLLREATLLSVHAGTISKG